MAPPVTPGYSGTPLFKKLGIKPGLKVCAINPPAGYKELLNVESPVTLTRLPHQASLIHLFAPSASVFYKVMEQLKPVIQNNPEIVIWVSWYKKNSGIPTDLNEDLIRDYALSTTLVDIKVCAVTDQWSGLKLVVRKNKRKPANPRIL